MGRSGFRAGAVLLGLMAALAGCNPDGPALVQQLIPLNGTTAVKTDATHLVRFRRETAVDGTNRSIVLYDVTNGAKKTVPGSMAIEGTVVRYLPKSPLRAKKDYMMEVKQAAIIGSDFEMTDGSESPEEVVTWPLRFHFSTRSAPRVRAAYLTTVEGSPKISVRFSQKMAPVATGQAVQILDGVTHKALRMRAPIWLDAATVLVEPAATEKMQSGQLYTLKVAVTARSADNTALDGDMDGTPGESKDHFCTGFTTIQRILFSRLGTKKPSACP